MKRFILSAVLLLVAPATVRAELQPRLFLAVEGKDTIVPLEPLYVRVAVVNQGESPLPVPKVNDWVTGQIFRFLIQPADSGRLNGTMELYPTPGPYWGQDTLMPGESVFARHDIIEDRPYSMQRYSIRVTWSPVTLGWHHPESRETSNAVSFVVRTPDSAEQAALDEYSDLSWRRRAEYNDNPLPGEPVIGDHEERLRYRRHDAEVRARRLLAVHSVEPYAMLTKKILLSTYRQQYVSEDWDQRVVIAPWGDSIRALYKEIITSRPDSPDITELLKLSEWHGALEAVDGREANAAFLGELVSIFPGTRVAREASRQLLIETRDR